MVCKTCGFEYEGTECPVCKILATEEAAKKAPKKDVGVCIAAMTFGIVSFCLLLLCGGIMSVIMSVSTAWAIIFYLVGLLPSVVGLTLSIVAMARRPRDPRAIVGLVLSILSVLIRVAMIGFCVVMVVLAITFHALYYILAIGFSIISGVLSVLLGV